MSFDPVINPITIYPNQNRVGVSFQLSEDVNFLSGSTELEMEVTLKSQPLVEAVQHELSISVQKAWSLVADMVVENLKKDGYNI